MILLKNGRAGSRETDELIVPVRILGAIQAKLLRFYNDFQDLASMQRGSVMTKEKKPVTIKKYANRRLYNTGASAYVTLEDLAEMVKAMISSSSTPRAAMTLRVGADADHFRTGREGGAEPIADYFLRQLIRFYGDSMQMLVPSYLEFSIGKLTSEQAEILRDKVAKNFGGPLTAPNFRLRSRNRPARTWPFSSRRWRCSTHLEIRSRRRPENSPMMLSRRSAFGKACRAKFQTAISRK